MDKTTLDLDILEPQGAQVKLGGKTYPVSPPRLKSLVSISRVYEQIQLAVESKDEKTILDLMEKFLKSLYPIIPDLQKEEGLDLSFGQITALMSFVMNLSTPEDMTPDEQKKILVQPDSSDTSVIS